jgi:TfoX N-terminal domain
MAYDELLADDVRAKLGGQPGLVEKEMFGGVAFMVGGNMAVGVSGSDLMVRVGKEAHEEAIARLGARVFDMTSRPMTGWILVGPDGYAAEDDFAAWIDRGVSFALSLPPK